MSGHRYLEQPARAHRKSEPIRGRRRRRIMERRRADWPRCATPEIVRPCRARFRHHLRPYIQVSLFNGFEFVVSPPMNVRKVWRQRGNVDAFGDLAVDRRKTGNAEIFRDLSNSGDARTHEGAAAVVLTASSTVIGTLLTFRTNSGWHGLGEPFVDFRDYPAPL